MKATILKKHPVTTLVVLNLIGLLCLDLAAGLILVPKNKNFFRIPHSYYHHGLLPNIQAVAFWQSPYDMYTNSLGFRDSAIRQIPLTSEKRRILLMGDSFTEALGVAYDESFAGRLSREMNRRDVEILNAGVLSYCPKIYYLKTKFLIENVGLKFDELFVCIDISDIQDEIVYSIFEPAYNPGKQNVSSLIRKTGWVSFLNYYIPRILYRGPKSYVFHLEWGTNLNTEPFKDPKFDVERFVWSLNPSSLERLTKDRNIIERWGPLGLKPDILEKWGYRGLELARKNMQKLVELCRQNNIKISIAVYPHMAQVYYDREQSLQLRFWEEFCRSLSVPFINLFPLFINQTPPAEVEKNYFIHDDIHWNARGHELVADELLKYLR